MTETIHGFRSHTAVVAYCGAVDRAERPRTEAVEPPPGACPECVTAYNSIRS